MRQLQAFNLPHMATKSDCIISPWVAHHAFFRSSLVPYQCTYNYQQTWCAYISIPKVTNMLMMCNLYDWLLRIYDYNYLSWNAVLMWPIWKYSTKKANYLNENIFYEQNSKGTSWKHILYKLNTPGTYGWILTNLKLCTLFDILICKVRY